MNNRKYNGWTNFETWKVNIEFLDGLSSKDLFDTKCDPNSLERLIWDIASQDVEPHSFADSCMQAFFVEVNWEELAEHLNEGV